MTSSHKVFEVFFQALRSEAMIPLRENLYWWCFENFGEAIIQQDFLHQQYQPLIKVKCLFQSLQWLPQGKLKHVTTNMDPLYSRLALIGLIQNVKAPVEGEWDVRLWSPNFHLRAFVGFVEQPRLTGAAGTFCENVTVRRWWTEFVGFLI